VSASVLQMPARPGRAIELEAVLVGAALHLRPTFKTFEQLGVGGDEFTVELHRKAWQIARRRAEKTLAVGATEVFAAGLKHGWFSGPELAQLEALEGANTLDAHAFVRVGRDFRRIFEGQRYQQALEQALARVRGRGFDPSAEAGWLSSLEAGLRAQGAQLEPLTVEQQRFLATWDEREASGRTAYIPTGFPSLDAELGGLPESLCLLVADGGVGKTAFQDTLLHSVLLANPEAKACLISPEDGVQHVVQRWLARDLGWKMRDVGSGMRRRSADDSERIQQISAAQYPLLDRVLGWKHRNVTADKLISLCWAAADAGCRVVSIDNFNKINISGLAGEDMWTRVQRLSDRLQEFGEKAGVAAIMLVHSTGDEASGPRKQVSATSGMQGGKSFGRDARLRLDLSKKNGALRVTIVKANTQAEQGGAIDFDRLAEAGMVRPESGALVDLHDEARRERAAREDERLLRQVAASKRRKALAEKEKETTETKAAEAEEQKALFDAEKQRAVEKPAAWGARWTAEVRDDAE